MNIESVKYNRRGEDFPVFAIIDGKTCSVCQSEDNRHWREILKWISEGNTIQPADE